MAIFRRVLSSRSAARRAAAAPCWVIKTVDLAQDAYQQEYTRRGGHYGLGPQLQSRPQRGNQSFVYYEKDLMNGLNALVQPEIRQPFKQQLLSQLEAKQLRL